MDNKFDLNLALIPKELKILLQLIVTGSGRTTQ